MKREELGRWIYERLDGDFDHAFTYRGIIVPIIYDWAEEMHAWCVEQFSDDLSRWSHEIPWQFLFRDDHDAFEFFMRWA